MYDQFHDVTQRWRRLGEDLRLSPVVLDKIAADQPDCEICFRETLNEWLKQVHNTDHTPAALPHAQHTLGKIVTRYYMYINTCSTCTMLYI